MNHLQFQVNIGTIAMTWTSQGCLSRIDWYDNSRVDSSSCEWFALSNTEMPHGLRRLVTDLKAYFYQGKPIDRIPWESMDVAGWTDFQSAVYRAIAQIPHGETRTYAWVARKVGKGAATRAVGQALRKNPLPILIPCHRVVGANALGGFMGTEDPNDPELRLKKWLIEVESSYLNPMFSFVQPTGSGLWSAAG